MINTDAETGEPGRLLSVANEQKEISYVWPGTGEGWRVLAGKRAMSGDLDTVTLGQLCNRDDGAVMQPY